MLAVERRNLILEKAHEKKKVIVSELSREFEVSEETIRRDLEKLEEDGHVTKSYGGAVLNEKSSIDLPFNVRWKANPEGKHRIAELICGEIEDGDYAGCFYDGGFYCEEHQAEKTSDRDHQFDRDIAGTGGCAGVEYHSAGRTVKTKFHVADRKESPGRD